MVVAPRLRGRKIALAAATLTVATALAVSPALGVGPTATSGTTVGVNVVAPTITITAPASVDFGSVTAGSLANAPFAFTVNSTVPTGYSLTASRTAFSGGDLVLNATMPAGAFSSGFTPAPGLAPPQGIGAIPVNSPDPTSVLVIGRRDPSTGAAAVTPPGGDVFNTLLQLIVPFGTAPGVHTSTLTLTAAGL
jgi:hypothetical protein